MIPLLLAAAALPPGPLQFRAEGMRYQPNERRILLDGDVHLDRQDLAVTSDHAVAETADPAKKAPPPPRGKKKKGNQPAQATLGGQEVERFTVDGKVHVVRGQRTADGEHGEMDVPQQTMILTGTPAQPPVVRDGQETLSGDRILMHLDSEDIDVTRPHVVLKRSLPVDDNQKQKPASPVRIEAQNLVVHKAARLAKFTDDVVVRRGDTVVKSPKMDAHYDQDGQLTLLQMRGGVDMRQGDRRAVGQSADYDAKARTLVLTGDPKVYDRGDVLFGDRIDLYLDSHEVKVDKAKGKLHPEIHKDEEAKLQ
ncbi:MAG TPA: LptA/OstA family protein [Myxococcales bacterium]|nr:LptA/OstA family protein [Myxococcales bacterium]